MENNLKKKTEKKPELIRTGKHAAYTALATFIILHPKKHRRNQYLIVRGIK